MARQSSMQELLIAAFDYQSEDIYTSMPAVVIRSDLENMLVDVQPSINIKFKNGEVAERPPILNVPIQFPSSSSSAITFPVNKGDIVLLSFSMRGLDAFKAGTGYPATPLDFRKFSHRDAVAIPGVWPKSRSVNKPSKRTWDHSVNDVVVVHNIGKATEAEFRIKDSGNIQVRTHKDIELIGDNIDITANTSMTITTPQFNVNATATNWLGNFSHNGNYTLTGTATFNGVEFNTHVHTDVEPGTGTSGGPQ